MDESVNNFSFKFVNTLTVRHVSDSFMIFVRTNFEQYKNVVVDLTITISKDPFKTSPTFNF